MRLSAGAQNNRAEREKMERKAELLRVFFPVIADKCAPNS